MRETATFDLSSASVNLAETLIQTRMFDDEVSSSALRRCPETLPEPVLEVRGVMIRAALAMATPYRKISPQDPPASKWWLPPRAIQETQRIHAASLRLMGRQLAVLKNLEQYAESRTPLPHMEAAKAARGDLLSSVVRFLQSHQPNGLEATVYQKLRKEGTIYTTNDVHQDHAMALVLREAGIGKPASEAYPAPLKALIVTPTDRDTYRLAYRRAGNTTFKRVAPTVDLMTTKRYTGLIKDQGGRVVVTHPEYLENAVLSGKMTNIQFDVVMTDNFSAEEAKDLHDLIHAQEVGPVILDFVIRPPHHTPDATPASREHNE